MVGVVQVVLALVALVHGAPSADEVHALPGWASSLPSPQYSGFVNASARSTFHYWFVLSENDPATDPLIVWMNGGPGASSMFGMMTEIGPLRISASSMATDPPSLWYNRYGWQRFANVLVVDQPPPTGFSYCGNDPAGDFSSCNAWDDETAAAENYAFLLRWFARFPEFSSAPLYVAGESYAGVYVPLLAELVYANMPHNGMQLAGLAVGDGCMGSAAPGCGGRLSGDKWWHLQFLYGHGALSTKLYEATVATCTKNALLSGRYSAACAAALAEVDAAAGPYFEYNIYDQCRHTALADPHGPAALHGAGSSIGIGAALNDYRCGGAEALAAWVNRSDVREALHVPQDARWNNADGDWPEYNTSATDVRPLYARWAGAGAAAGQPKQSHAKLPLRILIFSGDTDPDVMYLASENWTSTMGIPELEPWRPWFVPFAPVPAPSLPPARRVGGYVTSYDVGTRHSGGSFQFITVRGSGHMVPLMQPEASFELFSRWFHNRSLCLEPTSCSRERPRQLSVTATLQEARARRAALAGTLASERRLWAAREAALLQAIAED